MAPRAAFLALCLHDIGAIDNGLGQTPPMGWRSWNQFQCDIDQSLVEETYRIMASHDFGSKSLLELGYQDAGIDDCWQKCNSGPGGQGFHDASGYPIVDEDRFPDMRKMTKLAKSLGLNPGWYANNCQCNDQTCTDDKCFRGDVQATLDFGFNSIKLDSCGAENNMTKYAQFFNETGEQVLLEDCSNGNPSQPERQADGSVFCPMNFFRSSTDIRATYGSVVGNLISVMDFNPTGLTGPGCWAYPDMLEVGVTNVDVGDGSKTLNLVEQRTHFGAWCIVSAPLVLGNDLRDTATMKQIWDVIANEELIAVNQAWHGDAGRLVAQSTELVTFHLCSWWNDDCQHPSWMVWTKRLEAGKLAVLVMNNAPEQRTIDVKTSDLDMACSPCTQRDLYAHQDLKGSVTDGWSVSLGAHDSQFVILTPSSVEAMV